MPPDRVKNQNAAKRTPTQNSPFGAHFASSWARVVSNLTLPEGFADNTTLSSIVQRDKVKAQVSAFLSCRRLAYCERPGQATVHESKRSPTLAERIGVCVLAKSSADIQRSTSSRSPNRLLSALPEEDYRRLLPSIKTVPVNLKQVLHKAGGKIDTIYFPGRGVCSVTSVMSDGRMVEVATIGNEGMVGVTAFLGGDVSPGDVFVHVPDSAAQSMSAEAFKRELDRRGPFYYLLGRYAQALQALIMQSAACFSMHTVEERCSRWLLMTHDRIEGDDFQITHEFLSYMLGVRRPTVSLVLGTLERAGVIRNGTKKITVTNRKCLEAMSCECYQVIKDTFDRLLPSRL
jgi:CRP-like cAMP-binding protein